MLGVKDSKALCCVKVSHFLTHAHGAFVNAKAVYRDWSHLIYSFWLKSSFNNCGRNVFMTQGYKSEWCVVIHALHWSKSQSPIIASLGACCTSKLHSVNAFSLVG